MGGPSRKSRAGTKGGKNDRQGRDPAGLLPQSRAGERPQQGWPDLKLHSGARGCSMVIDLGVPWVSCMGRGGRGAGGVRIHSWASVMAQWAELPPVMMLVQVPAALLKIHLPANTHGKALEDGLSTWAPAPVRETGKLLAPDFGLAQSQSLWPPRQ